MGQVCQCIIMLGEKCAAKFADEIIVLSEGVQKYFMDTYGRETKFIPNGVNRPEIRDAKLIKEQFDLENVYSTNHIDVATSKRTCFAHYIGC